MAGKYPILLRRYLATLIDFLIPLVIATVIGKTFSFETEYSILASELLLVVPFLVYEPLMTSVFATVGQLIFRFRIRKLDEISRINIGQALIRLICKYLLSWVSFLTLPARSDRRAMHDLVSKSIAIHV